MASSNVGRLVLRRFFSINSSGTYEHDVVVPDGYRVVSGFTVIAEDEDGNYGDVDYMGGYPKTNIDNELSNDTWRFQFKVNASVALWLCVICERSDEPDVAMTLPAVYV